MRAKDIMCRRVVYVRTEEKLNDVISILVQNHVSGVPVIDQDNQIVGMISEKDLMTREKGLNISSYMEFVMSILMEDVKKKERNFADSTALDIMTTPVYSVHPEATIEEIVSLMMNRHINRIPVIDDESRLVGIIGRSDLIPVLIK